MSSFLQIRSLLRIDREHPWLRSTATQRYGKRFNTDGAIRFRTCYRKESAKTVQLDGK